MIQYTNALGGGTIADIFVQEKRGLAMSLFAMGPMLGPVGKCSSARSFFILAHFHSWPSRWRLSCRSKRVEVGVLATRDGFRTLYYPEFHVHA